LITGAANDRFRRSAGILALRREGPKCADSGRSPDCDRTAGLTRKAVFPDLLAGKTDRRVNIIDG
jgi:hypothetical protein